MHNKFQVAWNVIHLERSASRYFFPEFLSLKNNLRGASSIRGVVLNNSDFSERRSVLEVNASWMCERAPLKFSTGFFAGSYLPETTMQISSDAL